MTTSTFEYIQKRLLDTSDGQLNYFDRNAIKNQKRYRALKKLSIICNIMTTFTIALAFTVPDNFKVPMGIVALILSTIVLATYQWEEFHNYGAKWEKFRLVADIPTSPSSKSPAPSPIQGPHPDGRGMAPAFSRACQSPRSSLSFCTSLEAAAT